MEVDKKAPGSVNQSIMFVLESAALPITGMKLGYIRSTDGDGTSFTETLSGALTELAAITTAHTDNAAKYLDTDITGGNQFAIRVDFPDAAFASGKDKLICNVYDDGNDIIAQRIFDLSVDLTQYPDGIVYFDPTSGETGTVFNTNGKMNTPVNDENDAVTLALGVNKTIGIRGGTFPDLVTDLSGLTLIGKDAEATLALNSNTACAFTKITDINVAIAVDGYDGTPNSTTRFDNCKFDSNGIISSDGEIHAHNCTFVTSIINLDSKAELVDCETAEDDVLQFFLANLGSVVDVKRHVGNIEFKLANKPEDHSVNMVSGNIEILADCVDGSLVLTGTGILTDNSAVGFTVDKSGWVDLGEKHLAYPDGKIYFDKNATTNIGTDYGFDGTMDNPVTLESAAVTLATSLKTKHISIKGDFDMSVADEMNGFVLEARVGAAAGDRIIAAGTENSELRFINLDIFDSGSFGNIDEAIFDNCEVDGFHVDGLQKIDFNNCKVWGTYSADSEAEFTFNNCRTKKEDAFTLDLTNNMVPDIVKHAGNIDIINGLTSSSKEINMLSGNIVVGATNTLGNIILTGTGLLDKSLSGGTTVDESAWQQLSIPTKIRYEKNVASPNFPIYMVDDQNHISGKTGLTVAGAINKDDEGALITLTNPVTELGDGFYRVDLTAAEMNGDVINLRFTGSGADDRVISLSTNV